MTGHRQHHPIPSLAALERRAREVTSARRITDRTQITEVRLAAALEHRAALHRRQQAVAAVLRTPDSIPIRAIPEWIAEAMRDVPDDDRDVMRWDRRNP